MQLFIRSRGGFIATRLLLGFAEAGYIPGAVYTLSTWYTRKELAKRVAVLFFGMFGGNAISPLLALGILQLDGHRGIKGWEWLFLREYSVHQPDLIFVEYAKPCNTVEGLFTISVSFILLFFLPGSPSHPRPLLSPGLVRFTGAERQALLGRLAQDDHENTGGATGLIIPLKLVWRTVCHYKRWPHFVSTFVVFSTWSPLTTYTPSIMM